MLSGFLTDRLAIDSLPRIQADVFQIGAGVMAAILSHAAERGEIQDDIPPRVVTLPTGLFRHEFFIIQSPPEDQAMIEIVDDVFLPRVRARAAALCQDGTMPRQFRQVDVFTATPYRGNPLAVVHDADGLTTGQMQRFANWTNLSETTFLLPPADDSADYRVRIFTPSVELPFAGHPTLGSCHAWLEAGGRSRTPGVVIQQCGAGLVTIRQDDGGLKFAAPPLVRSGPVDEPLAQRVAEILGIGRSEIADLRWADNGPGWIAVLLESAEAVLALKPGPTELDLGVAGPYPPGSAAAFEVRAFTPKLSGTEEDPVTGSFNASLAQWLLASGRASAPYLAQQGTVLGRSGQVRITADPDGTVWVGGGVVTCVSGTVDL